VQECGQETKGTKTELVARLHQALRSGNGGVKDDSKEEAGSRENSSKTLETLNMLMPLSVSLKKIHIDMTQKDNWRLVKKDDKESKETKEPLQTKEHPKSVSNNRKHPLQVPLLIDSCATFIVEGEKQRSHRRQRPVHQCTIGRASADNSPRPRDQWS
jgi:hypothetical protein